MKHNIIHTILRWMAAAIMILASAACSKDDMEPMDPPQKGIIPTKIIFNVTRGGYEGDAETRAPKSGWEEGDVVYFGVPGTINNNTATYTGGEWEVKMNSGFPAESGSLTGVYAESGSFNSLTNELSISNGDVAVAINGRYEVGEDGVAIITLNFNYHPMGRMTFTGVGKGKELIVKGIKRISGCKLSTGTFEYEESDIFVTGEQDGTATIYGLPTPSIVSGNDITLKVSYNGVWYKKTFVNKVFKANSNITLAAPSVENGWTVDYIEYGASDLKLGDYYYADGTWSDGGLRKLYPDGEYEAETIAPLTGTDKRIIGIVIYAGRHATDNSDYTKALTEGGPTISGNVNGYAMAITNATGTEASITADRPAWLIGPGGAGDYIYDLESYISTNQYSWNGYANCQGIHNFVKDHADEGFEMRHFQAAWVCEIYGYRNWDYDGSVNGRDYTWQKLLKAPAGTSGWFLPSIGQLAYMRTNINYLDKRLEAVKGYSSGWPDYNARIVPLSYRYLPYWSSTIVSGENHSALYQDITPTKPNVAIKGNRNDPYLPRPILVF